MTIGWRTKGGVPIATLLSLVGCSGGWVDVSTEQPERSVGGTSGSAGESSGAPTQADPRYSFAVVPGAIVEGDDQRKLDIVARAVSDNGELIFGTMSTPIPTPSSVEELVDFAPAGLGVRSVEARRFYWTRELGARLWERDADPQCLSGDGSAMFTFAESGPGNTAGGLLRWSKDEGFRIIATAESQPDLGIQSCSYDGKRAAGYRGPAGLGMHGWLWAEGQWNDEVNVIDADDSAPDSAFGWVSPRGSVSVVTNYGSPTSLYWSGGAGELELLSQPHPDCAARPASRDGRVIVSFCSDDSGRHVYRWTSDTRVFESMGVLQEADVVTETSPDGSALAGTADNRLTYLKAGTTLRDVASDPLEVRGLSEDGSVVYLQQFGEIPNALSWTSSDGFQALESLPGRPCTELSFPDFRGARIVDGMAVGVSATNDDSVTQSCDWSTSRAVLWDSHGVRDIAAELKAAGVDLHGITLHVAERVWTGARIKVTGVGQLASGLLRSWIAELPPRD